MAKLGATYLRQSETDALISGIKTADVAIKSSPGKVYWVTISDTDAGVVQLNNSLDDTGTDLWQMTLPANGYGHFIFDPPIDFDIGIYLDVPTGTPDVIVCFL